MGKMITKNELRTRIVEARILDTHKECEQIEALYKKEKTYTKKIRALKESARKVMDSEDRRKIWKEIEALEKERSDYRNSLFEEEDKIRNFFNSLRDLDTLYLNWMNKKD